MGVSDAPLNGDRGPQGLRNAFRTMVGEIGRIRREVKRRRKAGYAKRPRQFCMLCLTHFDMAVIPPGFDPALAVCPKCRASLSDGYCAVLCLGRQTLFVRSKEWKEAGLAGKIIRMSPDQFSKLEENLKQQQMQEKKDAPRQGPNPDN